MQPPTPGLYPVDGPVHPLLQASTQLLAVQVVQYPLLPIIPVEAVLPKHRVSLLILYLPCLLL